MSVINTIYAILLALSISLLSVAQFRLALGGLEIPLLLLVVVVIFLAGVFGVGRDSFRFDRVLNRSFLLSVWSVVLLIALNLIDLIRTDGDSRVLQGVAKLLIGLLVLVFFYFIRVDRKVFYTSLCVFSMLVIGFYLYNSYYVLGAPYLVNNLEEVTKAGRNQIALYLSTTTVIIAYLFFVDGIGFFGRLVASAGFFVHFAALLYCSSRSAWVSFVVGVLPLLFLLKWKAVAGLGVVFSVLVFGALAGMSERDAIVDEMLSSIEDRVVSIFSGVDPEGEGSIALRGELISSALSDFSESPLFGIGAEQFLARHDYVTHNTYLQFLVENGLLGAILFCLPIVLIAFRTYFSISASRRWARFDVGLLACMGCVCFFVNIAFVNILSAPLYFFLVGFALSQSHYASKGNNA